MKGLAEYYGQIIDKAIADCTTCGDCLRYCLMSSIRGDRDPQTVMEKLIGFLNGGEASDEVYFEAFTCAYCGYCSNLCPAGLDPMVIREATKNELIKKGRAVPEAVGFLYPNQRINLYEILTALQTKPSEQKWLKNSPAEPKKAENVLFLGCFLSALPHFVFSIIDIFERLNIDFITLSGGEVCCGTIYCPAGGMVEKADEKARELVKALHSFSPERVIMFCTGCYRQFTEFFPDFINMDFKVQFYTDFLLDNIDKLNLSKPVNITATYHKSCMTRRTKVAESGEKLLKAIPGLKLVEMKDSERLCCGGLGNMTAPEYATNLTKSLVEAISETKADYVTTYCPFCMLAFYPYLSSSAWSLIDLPRLISESTEGKVYEDKLAQYWKMSSVGEIIETTKENFLANGYSEDEMRSVLPLIFRKAV